MRFRQMIYFLHAALALISCTEGAFTSWADSSAPVLDAAKPLTGAELTSCVQGGQDRKCPMLVGVAASISAPSTFGLPPGPGVQLPSAAQPLIMAGTASSPETDGNGGILYVAKTTAYRTAGLRPGNAPAISGVNVIKDGVWGNQTGVLGYVANGNTQHSQPDGTASAVGTYGIGACSVSNCSATWGGVIAYYDTTGSANPKNPQSGLEVDSYAHGTDGNNVRVGLQVNVGRPDGAGAPNVVTSGLIMSATSGDGSFGNMITGGVGTVAVNGLNLGGVTFSGLAIQTPGFAVDAGGAIVATRTIKLTSLTVATLPTCNANNEGTLAFVTDLKVTPSYNKAIGAGGGTERVLALCRNSAWTSH